MLVCLSFTNIHKLHSHVNLLCNTAYVFCCFCVISSTYIQHFLFDLEYLNIWGLDHDRSSFRSSLRNWYDSSRRYHQCRPRQAITITNPDGNFKLQNYHNYLSNLFLRVSIVSNFLGAENQMFLFTELILTSLSFCCLGAAELLTPRPPPPPSYAPGFHNVLLIWNNSKNIRVFSSHHSLFETYVYRN